MIGMYKKLLRLIEREKVGFLMRVGNRLVFATNNWALCLLDVYGIYRKGFLFFNKNIVYRLNHQGEKYERF
ncbi:hypothetical protein CN634_28150 [Bacillus pseudomycoides]|nr:hypothetical protein CN634_28150 [Bacillus pseudomycoides]